MAGDQREDLHAAKSESLVGKTIKGEVPGGLVQGNRERIMMELSTAQLALGKAYQLAITANSMAADLPLFQQLKSLQNSTGHIMQGVAKVRGL